MAYATPSGRTGRRTGLTGPAADLAGGRATRGPAGPGRSRTRTEIAAGPRGADSCGSVARRERGSRRPRAPGGRPDAALSPSSLPHLAVGARPRGAPNLVGASCAPALSPPRFDLHPPRAVSARRLNRVASAAARPRGHPSAVFPTVPTAPFPAPQGPRGVGEPCQRKGSLRGDLSRGPLCTPPRPAGTETRAKGRVPCQTSSETDTLVSCPLSSLEEDA